jgi:hypothetical protein
MPCARVRSGISRSSSVSRNATIRIGTAARKTTWSDSETELTNQQVSFEVESSDKGPRASHVRSA